MYDVVSYGGVGIKAIQLNEKCENKNIVPDNIPIMESAMTNRDFFMFFVLSLNMRRKNMLGVGNLLD